MDPSSFQTEPTTTAPVAGRTTLTIVIGWIVLIALASMGLDQVGFDSALLLAGYVLVGGSFYGMVGAAGWMMTCLSSPWWRAALRLTLVMIAALGMMLYFGNRDWPEYVIYLGGMTMVQSILFSWASVPAWQSLSKPKPAHRIQFSVAEILVGTTGVALGLGIIMRLDPPTRASMYWMVAMGTWIALPLISLTACLAVAKSVGVWWMIWNVIGVTASGLTALVLAKFEPETEPDQFFFGFWDFTMLYGALILGFFVSFELISWAGYRDGRLAQRHRQQGLSSGES